MSGKLKIRILSYKNLNSGYCVSELQLHLLAILVSKSQLIVHTRYILIDYIVHDSFDISKFGNCDYFYV